MKKLIQLLTVVIISIVISSCNGCRQIPANQTVLNSANYGKSWEKLDPDDIVPTCNMPGCYNLYLSNSPMGGELSSVQRVGKTGESAKVKMLYTYQWEIADHLKFITEAKELRGGGDYTSDAALEGIEGRLIDRNFHDISGPLLENESVRNFNQSAYEEKLNTAINNEMESKYGIRIFAISCVPEFGGQLEGALDDAQALDFYKSIGEEDLGRQILISRASAPKIYVDSKD
jgi:hypothetical protein